MEQIWWWMTKPTFIANASFAWALIVFFILLFISFRELRYVVWKAVCFAGAITALVYIVRIVQ